jgi:hypothetical protein
VKDEEIELFVPFSGVPHRVFDLPIEIARNMSREDPIMRLHHPTSSQKVAEHGALFAIFLCVGHEHQW